MIYLYIFLTLAYVFIASIFYSLGDSHGSASTNPYRILVATFWPLALVYGIFKGWFITGS